MTILPNFLVVGAGKAGTTWLHTCLEEHPEVFVPGIKEVNFFSRHYEQGFTWYESFFRECAAEKAIGEISPAYMVTPQVPERIHAWNPDVQLLFILRNPVERAYSHYCMHLRAGKVSENVAQVLVPGTRYVDDGLYYSHIMQFLKFFEREQIKVLIYDELKNNPELFLQDVFSFLGVEPLFKPQMLHKVYHVRKTRPRFQQIYNWLVLASNWVAKGSPYGSWLTESLRKKGYVDILHRLNRGPEFPVLSKEKEQILAEFYRQDVLALSDFIGQNLSCWLAAYSDS